MSKKDQETDWQGRPIPDDETPDTEILVWEIEPHLQASDCDFCWVRGWQRMLAVVSESLDCHLENFTEDELIEGVEVKFRLRKMRRCDYDEAVDVGA